MEARHAERVWRQRAEEAEGKLEQLRADMLDVSADMKRQSEASHYVAQSRCRGRVFSSHLGAVLVEGVCSMCKAACAGCCPCRPLFACGVHTWQLKCDYVRESAWCGSQTNHIHSLLQLHLHEVYTVLPAPSLALPASQLYCSAFTTPLQGVLCLASIITVLLSSPAVQGAQEQLTRRIEELEAQQRDLRQQLEQRDAAISTLQGHMGEAQSSAQERVRWVVCGWARMHSQTQSNSAEVG